MVLIDGAHWLVDNYNRKWTGVDHRVDGWLFMSSITSPLLVLALYLTIVVYGPKWMHHRKPFDLKWVLFTYNMSIAILSIYMFCEMLTVTYRLGYSWLCEPVRLNTDPDEMRLVSALHLYFVSKLIEFLDTIFIILRKKSSQLSFLHVYHHSTMFFLFWIIVRWVPGGNAVFAPVINCFVHVVMYAYYGLSVLGPNVAKHLWWKRYITILQLIQFIVGLTLGINFFFIRCTFTLWLQYLTIGYMLSYLFLFGRFYVAAYVVGKAKMEKRSKGLSVETWEKCRSD